MTEDPLIGSYLGAYRIDRLLGQGGMARVYYGWDENLHRAVAIKVIDARHRQDSTYAERFVQEARAVATWRHENILQVYYAGQENGLYYFATEYIDGPDLSRLLAQYAAENQLIPQEDVLRIGWAVANALAYAHEHKVVHRDVKPSNVMVAKDGRIVLADFGLAMDLRQGTLGESFGTPHYIAPEQARNSALAVPQSDLYALGVILYEMLTGSVPFDDPSPTSLAVQHVMQPPPPPRQINPALNQATEDVLLKALQKQPADRYQTGTALMTALAEASAAATETHSSPTLPPLPAGMGAGTAVPPTPANMSVAQRVSLFTVPDELKGAAASVRATPPPTPPLPASQPPAPQPPASRPPAHPPMAAPSSALPLAQPAPASNRRWLFIGGGVLLLLLFLVGRSFLGGEDTQNTVASPTGTAVTEVTEDAATAAPVAAAPTTDSATAVVLPTNTVTAVAEPEIPVDNTVEASPIPSPESTDTVPAPPTETPLPPPTPTEETAAAEATIAYPNGHRFVLLYDENSFYAYNPEPDRLRASSLSFEALNNGGNTVGYAFQGSSWAQFYSFIEQGKCMRIEINRAPSYLRPGQCSVYNSTVTPRTDDVMIFWTDRPSVTQFRVLWDGQEVGRCEIGAGSCEVYLP